MHRLDPRKQQRVVEAWRHNLKKDPKEVMADLVFKKIITGEQARELVTKHKHIVDMLVISREAGSHKREAEQTRDPSFYGIAGKLFVDAATQAMKAGMTSYATIFLKEAIDAKKIAHVPEEEIYVLMKTLEGLKQ